MKMLLKNNSVHGGSAYFKVAQKHRAICATSPLVDSVLILEDSSLTNNKLKMQKINISELLLELSDYQKRILIDCFDNDDIRSICIKASGATLLLAQRKKLYMTEIETGVMYQYLVDYFGEPNSKIAVKAHPSANSSTHKYNLKEFFDSAIVFPISFPADLLPIVEDFKIKKAVTISSTSIERLTSCCEELVSVGKVFFELYKSINKFYFSYKVIEVLGMINETIYRNCIGNPDVIHSLNKNAFSSKFNSTIWTNMCDKHKGITICGDIKHDQHSVIEKYYNYLETLSKDELIIYLNLENNFSFIDYYHKDLLENIVTLEISKTPIKEKIFADIKSEYIYVYTTNPSHRNMLKNICIEKQLPNVGFDLILKYIDNSKLYNAVLCKHIDMLTEKVDKYTVAVEKNNN